MSRRSKKTKEPRAIQRIFDQGENAINHLGAAAKGGWAATRGFLQPKKEKYDDSGKYSQSEY